MDLINSLPDEITKEEYNAVRKSYQTGDSKYPDWYIGAVGFLASYNGKFFGGRAGIVKQRLGQCETIMMKQNEILCHRFLI